MVAYMTKNDIKVIPILIDYVEAMQTSAANSATDIELDINIGIKNYDGELLGTIADIDGAFVFVPSGGYQPYEPTDRGE